jgi:hypothetical protein
MFLILLKLLFYQFSQEFNQFWLRICFAYRCSLGLKFNKVFRLIFLLFSPQQSFKLKPTNRLQVKLLFSIALSSLSCFFSLLYPPSIISIINVEMNENTLYGEKKKKYIKGQEKS